MENKDYDGHPMAMQGVVREYENKYQDSDGKPIYIPSWVERAREMIERVEAEVKETHVGKDNFNYLAGLRTSVMGLKELLKAEGYEVK